MSRPLANRVDPSGAILAVQARGTMMGNRGGRIHLVGKRLGRRRWASRQWICCVLEFKARRREVMGPGYTELFFLDEATALAAGHRPCFECRRAEALAFAAAMQAGLGLAGRPSAPAMDRILHPQRLGPPDRVAAGALPDGAMFRSAADGAGRGGPAAGAPFLKLGAAALPWSWEGYGPAAPLPRGEVEALTPPAIRAALSAGYAPHLHPTATREGRD